VEESEEDRPHGARRSAMERALNSQLQAEIDATGCVDLSSKNYLDARGEPLDVTMKGCMFSFTLNTAKNGQHVKRGVVRGYKVLVEPPFPEGKILANHTVLFEGGAKWNRKWH